MYGEILKDIRDRKNLNQKQVANLLGISNTLYCDYENENQIIPIKYLNLLANKFNISIDYLLGFSKTLRPKIYNEELDKKVSGNRIKNFRKDNNLTQIELAKILNIGNGTIAEYERGKYFISTHALYDICKKYNISSY